MSDGGGVLSTLVVYLGARFYAQRARARAQHCQAAVQRTQPPAPPPGGYLFLLLLAICLATGLYYMAELVEEYSRLTKRVITYALRAVLALHLALLLFDRQPVSCVLVGAAAHGAYARLLPRFPFVQLGSVDFGGRKKRSRNLFGALLGSALQKAQGVLGLASGGRASRSDHLY